MMHRFLQALQKPSLPGPELVPDAERLSLPLIFL
jgi:hypothetical protein